MSGFSRSSTASPGPSTRWSARPECGPEAIDRVFLTGGSSFVPAVRDIFIRTFGRDKLAGGNELTRSPPDWRCADSSSGDAGGYCFVATSCGHVIDAAVGDDLLHLDGVGDVRERIAVDRDQIRELAGLDGAAVVAERLRGIDGRGLQRVERRHARHRVGHQLAVQVDAFGVSVPATTRPPAFMMSSTILPLPPRGSPPPPACDITGCAATWR